MVANTGIDNTLKQPRISGRFVAKEVLEQGYIISIFEIEDAAVEVL